MGEKSIEERLQRLEEVYEKRLQRLEDIHEIQSLMSRHEYRGSGGRDFTDLYAQKTLGVTTEVAGSGVKVGFEAMIKKRVKEGEHEHPPGFMAMYTLTTPVIEVAGDGKTAKGVWVSPGHETKPDRDTGKLRAFWSWNKIGCDFVKENGVWKIWHYHVYRIFVTPYDIPWTEEYELKTGADTHEGAPKPDRPTTYHHPYSTTTYPEYVPAPPEPYETFDETTAY